MHPSLRILPFAFLLCLAAKPPGFKEAQMKYPRVKNAYAEKQDLIRKELQQHGLQLSQLNILLIAYKQEAELELWVKDKNSKAYKLLKTFEVCSSSGDIGPKRRMGDNQVPEGFYYIERFNPASNFHLSLGISYPNKSDRIFSKGVHPGGDIFIHGNCVTIGCLPITDDKIRELYVYAVEASNNGQSRIPAYIFPARLNDKNFESLKKENAALASFWTNLRQGYDIFQKKKEALDFSVAPDGKYIFGK